MASLRAVRGAMGNFLGAFTSRYSDFDGYWLFGMLADKLDGLVIDLLLPNIGAAESPLQVARQVAISKFADQLSKANVGPRSVANAQLVVRRVSEELRRAVNGHPSTGYDYRFECSVQMVNGRSYQRDLIVFVAPHNPRVESRSARLFERKVDD